ncbi:MAG TPA: hypothetical protein VN541_05085 [Tepidisphaeraceae bacterium]|nr:hypothetical protein [Tepidisphaeraceae bacterium]
MFLECLSRERRECLSGLRRMLTEPDQAWLEMRLWVDADLPGQAPGELALFRLGDLIRAKIREAVLATQLTVFQSLRQTRPARLSEGILLDLACERMERRVIGQEARWRRTHAEFKAAD